MHGTVYAFFRNRMLHDVFLSFFYAEMAQQRDNLFLPRQDTKFEPRRFCYPFYVALCESLATSTAVVCF